MPREPVREIVAGIDGSAGATAALDLAAAEAALRSAPLTLVHVTAGDRSGALPDAVARVRATRPDLTVHAERLGGDPATALASRSAGASLLVLGHDAYRRGRRGAPHTTGSVAATLLGLATVPVLVCPESPASAHGAGHPATAGASGPAAGTIGASGPVIGTIGASGPVAGTIGASGPVAGTIGASRPVAGTIGASRPVAGTIGASRPVAGTIGASRPVAGTIGASRPVAGTVGASRPVAGTVGASGPVAGLSGTGLSATGGAGDVVVGVDGTPGSGAALRFGFAEADLRHASLTAIHLWPSADDQSPSGLSASSQVPGDRSPGGESPSGRSPGGQSPSHWSTSGPRPDGRSTSFPGPDGRSADGLSAAEGAFLDLLETWSAKYPDVPVRLAVRHGLDAAIVLAAASRSARLVVVGGLAGPALSALVTRAACPVAVIPATA
ncbi:universal stress protein [Phytohabitans sp. ZYX-F-186]|uniref:Universal stress protein n=1 Tax=Phytohabitans maris TaxID=3071409 RepID=A0ABU0ZTP6_9ACTN|nr:universal stress protein [Phytohabitans sp. ZYX-F-186]MDQ7910406.1 universal stress protein [Phytohabitans sp. ZYX-F-186]